MSPERVVARTKRIVELANPLAKPRSELTEQNIKEYGQNKKFERLQAKQRRRSLKRMDTIKEEDEDSETET